MGMFKTDKVLDRLNRMLDLAIAGKDIEQGFDESKVSAIESKLYDFLMMNGSHCTKLREL